MCEDQQNIKSDQIYNQIKLLSYNKDKYFINEWILSSYCEDKNERTINCFCGRLIKHIYEFTNVITNENIILGSGCQKIFNNQIKKYKKNKSIQNKNVKPCLDYCGEMLDKYSYKTRCKKCYKKFMFY